MHISSVIKLLIDASAFICVSLPLSHHVRQVHQAYHMRQVGQNMGDTDIQYILAIKTIFTSLFPKIRPLSYLY